MKKTVKVAYVGCGGRACWVLQDCLRHMKDVEFPIICDIRDRALDRATELLVEMGRPAPKRTHNFDEVLKDPEIDAVMIMTGWEDRAEMAAKSLRAGKYTAIEVGCAFELSECYHLLDAYEETKVPLMMLENCCYSRREMMALNVAKKVCSVKLFTVRAVTITTCPKKTCFATRTMTVSRGLKGRRPIIVFSPISIVTVSSTPPMNWARS